MYQNDINENNECDKIYNPPFEGTIFIDPDIIKEDDPTTFVSLSYAGTGIREMYDRRLGGLHWNLIYFLQSMMMVYLLKFRLILSLDRGRMLSFMH